MSAKGNSYTSLSQIYQTLKIVNTIHLHEFFNNWILPYLLGLDAENKFGSLSFWCDDSTVFCFDNFFWS